MSYHAVMQMMDKNAACPASHHVVDAFLWATRDVNPEDELDEEQAAVVLKNHGFDQALIHEIINKSVALREARLGFESSSKEVDHDKSQPFGHSQPKPSSLIKRMSKTLKRVLSKSKSTSALTPPTASPSRPRVSSA
jgi:hypothetical protein